MAAATSTSRRVSDDWDSDMTVILLGHDRGWANAFDRVIVSDQWPQSYYTMVSSILWYQRTRLSRCTKCGRPVGFSRLTKDEKRFCSAAIAGARRPCIGGEPCDFFPRGDLTCR